MPGPYIDVYGKDAMKDYYRDKLMPWVSSGGPGTWDKKVGTAPPSPPKDLKDEQYEMIRKLLLSAFGGGAGVKRYDTWRNEGENRAAHGPSMWGMEAELLTP